MMTFYSVHHAMSQEGGTFLKTKNMPLKHIFISNLPFHFNIYYALKCTEYKRNVHFNNNNNNIVVYNAAFAFIPWPSIKFDFWLFLVKHFGYLCYSELKLVQSFE